MKLLKYILCSFVLALSVFPTIAQNQRFNIYREGNLLYSMPASLIDSINVEILPDIIAPHPVNNSENLYTSTNNGRTITILFNEIVFRGEGAISFFITGTNLSESYASGTIDNVVIDDQEVTITLPEDVVFDESQSCSIVFLEFDEGAFVDEYGNRSNEMKKNEPNTPWWTTTNEHPLQATGILGTYEGSGPSLFSGEEDIVYNWTCEITPASNSINGVWISQLAPYISGASYQPIYGVVSDDMNSIRIEGGQSVGSYGEYTLKLDFADNKITSVTATRSGSTFTINNLVTYAAYAGNTHLGYLTAVSPVTLTKVEE